MSAGARMKRHERRQQPPELKIVATEQPDEPTVYTISEQKEETLVITGTEIQEPIEAPKPRVTDFVARPCMSCTALRPENSNYTRVVTTRREGASVIRYCKCDFCGNTFKD